MSPIEAGGELRRRRERLRLRYRDVEEASLRLQEKHANSEFAIGLSRLADIENKGTVPTIYRMYSLAVIYGMDYAEIAGLYGVPFEQMGDDMRNAPGAVTRTVRLSGAPSETVSLPAAVFDQLDMKKSGFIWRQSQKWGPMPLRLLKSLETANHRYAFVGTDDWSMHPLLPPGSFVQVDERRKRIMNSGWRNEMERPIYLLEMREGCRFRWCTERGGSLIVMAHPSSPEPPATYDHPGPIEIVGQVVAVAMRFDRARARHTRSA